MLLRQKRINLPDEFYQFFGVLFLGGPFRKFHPARVVFQICLISLGGRIIAVAPLAPSFMFPAPSGGVMGGETFFSQTSDCFAVFRRRFIITTNMMDIIVCIEISGSAEGAQ